MAKVLITTYSNVPNAVLDPFRQGFADALVAQGNDVLLLKTNGFFLNYTASNNLMPDMDSQALTDSLVGFQPDLVISFNHSGLYSDLVNSLTCPIAVWLLDGPPYMTAPDQCKLRSNRYHMFTPVRAFGDDLQGDFGFNPNQIHFLPFCSDFRSEPSIVTHNISFVGIFFNAPPLRRMLDDLCNNRKVWARFTSMLESYKHEPNLRWNERLRRYRLETVFVGPLDEAWILNTLATNNRIRTLESIRDLGLTIYGTTAGAGNWLDTMYYSIELTMSYNPKPMVTREDIQQIYNSSKVVFNISHAQAKGGLPWRVFDAMASNAVLVSDTREDLHTLFGSEVQIPCYSTPDEARAVCSALLSNENKRSEIVRICNQIIDQGHRFKHRFATISETTGVNLMPGGTGTLSFVNPDDVSVRDTQTPPNGNNGTKDQGNNTKFKVEFFYSDSPSFKQENSHSITKSLCYGDRLHAGVQLPTSPKYLRVDIGTHFSTHKNPKLVITKLNPSKGKKDYELDFQNDLIASNQFVYRDGKLICGFDAQCIFENPFAGNDIFVQFESLLTTGI